jgi:uncharacterized membrane protein
MAALEAERHALLHSAAGAALWTRYRAKWTAWNHMRTAASFAAAALFIAAVCMQA